MFDYNRIHEKTEEHAKLLSKAALEVGLHEMMSDALMKSCNADFDGAAASYIMADVYQKALRKLRAESK